MTLLSMQLLTNKLISYYLIVSISTHLAKLVSGVISCAVDERDVGKRHNNGPAVREYELVHTCATAEVTYGALSNAQSLLSSTSRRGPMSIPGKQLYIKV